MAMSKMRKDVYAEFKSSASPAVLDQSGREAEAEIFDITVDAFASRLTKVQVDVWKLKRFRRFILGQTKKIAIEAKKNAKAARDPNDPDIITRDILNAAATKVMKKTQKFCKLAIKRGKIVDLMDGHYTDYAPGNTDGEVCSSYLAIQTY